MKRRPAVLALAALSLGLMLMLGLLQQVPAVNGSADPRQGSRQPAADRIAGPSLTPPGTFHGAGNALQFNGAGSARTQAPVTTQTQNVALEAWVNWTGGDAYNRFLVYNGNTALDGYGLMMQSGYVFILLGNKQWFMASDRPLPPGWQHVALVNELDNNRGDGLFGQQVWKLYLNGVQQKAHLDYNSASSDVARVAGIPTVTTSIGSNNGGGENFFGGIDEVRVWTVGRSARDIAANFALLLQGNERNLEAYWRLDDTGGTAADATSNRHDATLSGFPSGISPSVTSGAILNGTAGTFAIPSEDFRGPSSSNVTLNPGTPVINTSATLSATVSDRNTGDSFPVVADYTIDGGTYEPMAIQNGPISSVTEPFQASVSFASATQHQVCVVGIDASGNIGPASCITVLGSPDLGGGTSGPGYTLSCAPVSIMAGQTGSALCAIGSLSTTFSGTIALSCSTVPASLACTGFSRTGLTRAASNSYLSISVPAAQASGTYTVVVRGASGTSSSTANVAVTVTGPPDFSLRCDRTLFSMVPSDPTSVSNALTSTCTVGSLFRFIGTVSLACGAGLADGMGCSFSQPLVTLTDGGSAAVTLTLTGSPTSPPAGDPLASSFAVSASSGLLSHALSTSLTLMACGPSTAPATAPSTANDGIPDEYKRCGAMVNGSLVNLPAIASAAGAVPGQQLIFVQQDWMEGPDARGVNQNMRTSQDARNLIGAAFDAHNIKLIWDEGPDSVINPATGQTLGNLSHARSIPFQASLGTITGGQYDWTDFDTIKNANFIPTGYASVAHYSIAASTYGGSSSSGLARGNPSSDFIVSLGKYVNPATKLSGGTAGQQTGANMHELGHNFGLGHGGGDTVNNKPNYLSVMNYSFQMNGVPYNGGLKFDYSEAALDSLDETALDPNTGLSFGGLTALPDGTLLANYGTYHYCNGSGYLSVNAVGAIPWNCSGASSGMVSYDINGDGACVASASVFNPPQSILTGDDIVVAPNVRDGTNRACDTVATGTDTQVVAPGTVQPNPLVGYNDWANLGLKAGMIGQGAGATLPRQTEIEQDTPDTFAQVKTPPAPGAPPLDITPPTTTATVTANGVSFTSGSWTTSSVGFNLSAADNPGGSGVKTLNYRIGANAWVSVPPNGSGSFSANFSVSAQGQAVVLFYATDVAGNSETAHKVVVGIDNTPPSCDLTGVIDGPPKQLQITVQDSVSGLQSVVVTTLDNATLDGGIPAHWPAGTTDPVVFTATKLDQSQGARVALLLTDVAGNQTACDSVSATLKGDGKQPESVSYHDIAQEENRVTITNGTPGLTQVRIEVNGHEFPVALENGEKRTMDIGRALHAGDDNTVTLTYRGPKGSSADVLIGGGTKGSSPRRHRRPVQEQTGEHGSSGDGQHGGNRQGQEGGDNQQGQSGSQGQGPSQQR